MSPVLGRARIGDVHRRLLLTLACASLVLASCGGGDDDSSDAPRDDSVGASTDSTGGDSELLPSAGDAPAAQGAGLAEPPGPADRELLDGFGEVAIAVTGPDGSIVGWCVLLAETAEQRQQGLMEVTDLGGYPGMLFVWADDNSSSFWMQNTPMPLSIAWIDASGEIVSTSDMEPCGNLPTCPLYAPEGNYRFALEVPKGQLDELGLVEGATVRVGGSCAST
jgi:uncharacterized membrane protein (UPF0127 family)